MYNIGNRQVSFIASSPKYIDEDLCLFELEFYSQANIVMVMLSQVIWLSWDSYFQPLDLLSGVLLTKQCSPADQGLIQ